MSTTRTAGHRQSRNHGAGYAENRSRDAATMSPAVTCGFTPTTLKVVRA